VVVKSNIDLHQMINMAHGPMHVLMPDLAVSRWFRDFVELFRGLATTECI
jgi:hypothetical protein